MRVLGETLTPLVKRPDLDGFQKRDSKRVGSGLGQWMRGLFSRAPSVTSSPYKRSDLRLLLRVMGATLAPVPVSASDPLPYLSIKDTPIMNPDMWYVELAVGGIKVHAGYNGKLVWRHTPWLGSFYFSLLILLVFLLVKLKLWISYADFM